MAKENINVEVINDNRNIFEELLVTIMDSKQLHYKVQAEVLINSIEKEVKLMELNDTDFFKKIVSEVQEALRSILRIIKNESFENRFEILMDYLIIMELIFRNSGDQENEIPISQLFMLKPVTRTTSFDPDNTRMVGYEMFQIEKSIQKFLISKEFSDIILNARSKVLNIPWWTIELRISNSKEHKGLYTLWYLIDFLSEIDGFNVEIQALQKGSILAKLKAFFRDKGTQDNVEKALVEVQNFATGKLLKDYEEYRNTISERGKIEIETELKKKELEEYDVDFNQRIRELQLESLELKNENDKLNNRKLQIELFNLESKALKQMLAEELISNEEFRMSINNNPFMIKTKKRFKAPRIFGKKRGNVD